MASVVVLFLVWPAVPAAHDIPNDVTVQAFVKPEGTTLRLLVRVPLLAMRDMDYPKRAGSSNFDLLDLPRAERSLRDAATLWVADDVSVYEENVKLAYPRVTEVRASLPSDRSFASYEEALAHVTGPRLPADTEFFWSQGMLDVLFEYPIQSDRSRFSFEPRLGRLGLRTLTIVRFLFPDGGMRTFELHGDPGIVRLDPRWHQVVAQFVRLGFRDILGRVDALLFLACLVMPFRRIGPLVSVVAAFTVAHSITLIASAYSLAPDALWFPPFIETLIALSVVYMAIENIVSPQRQRWMIAFAFGLAYGFGFSVAVRDALQFAGSHLPTSLLAFNIGIELGQLFVLVLLVPALAAVVPLRGPRAAGDDRPVGVRGAHVLALARGTLRGAAAVPVSVAGDRRRLSRHGHAVGHVDRRADRGVLGSRKHPGCSAALPGPRSRG